MTTQESIDKFLKEQLFGECYCRPELLIMARDKDDWADWWCVCGRCHGPVQDWADGHPILPAEIKNKTVISISDNHFYSC